ncbi:ThuA domain-containing protein [Planctomycetota bacterium]
MKKNCVNVILCVSLTAMIVCSTSCAVQKAEIMPVKPIKTLLVDGFQKYHKYKDTSPVLKDMLEKSGRFTVDLSRAPNPTPEEYKPDFSAYDLIVVNEGFGSSPWPKATEKAFEAYIKNGGGMVCYHAANNAWPKWKAYNEMTAVGGWGGRNEKSGPYLYMNKAGKVIRDTKPGKGGDHGKQEEFEIVVRDEAHPITKGLPKTFLHGPDELYSFLRGPAENVTILATAHSRKDNKGSGFEEPMLMVIEWGQGRIFHTVLGHDVKQIKEGSFVTTFLRGAEWAATGKVTIPVPADFPNQVYPPQTN